MSGPTIRFWTNDRTLPRDTGAKGLLIQDNLDPVHAKHRACVVELADADIGTVDFFTRA